MKRLASAGMFLIGACLSLAACTDEGTVGQQGGPTVLQPLKTTRHIEKSSNILAVQKSIQEFYAANGRYPADLNEVASFNGITLENDKYSYDPETGTLKQRPD